MEGNLWDVTPGPLAENVLGHVELATGNLDAARDRFVKAVAGFRALGSPWGTGHATSALAWVALSTGDAALSERLLDEATAALGEAGPWFLMLTLYVRAILAVRRGSLDEALGFVRESLTRVRDLHDKFAFVYARLRPWRDSRAMMHGRRGSWALGMSSPSEPVLRSSISRSMTSQNRRAERCVHAWARLGGHKRTRWGACPQSMRC